MKENYLGWSNIETWNTNLMLSQIIEEMKKDSKSWIELSEKIKLFVEEIKEDALKNNTPSSVEFIINVGSLHRVDFDEIAQDNFEE